MSRTQRRRVVARVLIVGIVALTIPFGGAAYAYWSAGGTGPGAGSTGTLAQLSLSPGIPAADLYPGAQTNVVLTASNPNTEATRIGSLLLDTSQGTGGFAVDGGHAACGVATLSYTTQTNGGAGWTVPARVGLVNGSLAITLVQALSMSTAAPNACQGATFTVYLRAG